MQPDPTRHSLRPLATIFPVTNLDALQPICFGRSLLTPLLGPVVFVAQPHVRLVIEIY